MPAAPWLTVPRPHPAAVCRLWCIPNAGAGVMAFRGWADALPHVEVGLASLPGRDSRRREPGPASLHEAAHALTACLDDGPSPPLMLFGHSMGALIAYEMAHELTAQGRPPAALVVSGRRAPQCASRFPPVAHLPEAAFIEQMQHRYGGIPDLVLHDEELRAWFVPILQADMALVDRYVPSSLRPLTCPIFVYGGTTDPQTTPAELQAWADRTSGSCHLRWFAGGHFFTETARTDVLATIARDVASVVGAAEAR